MDITNSISNIIDMMVTGILNTWNTMQNITFFGTNLLTFTVTITILNVMIPLLITVTQIHNTKVGKEIRRK